VKLDNDLNPEFLQSSCPNRIRIHAICDKKMILGIAIQVVNQRILGGSDTLLTTQLHLKFSKIILSYNNERKEKKERKQKKKENAYKVN